MSATPTTIQLITLESEVERLLHTKEEFLTRANRSSAARSRLRMLYEELESAWTELTTPPEQQKLNNDTASFELKKEEWRHSLRVRKRNLRESKTELKRKLNELTLSSEQLTAKLTQRSAGEWRQSEMNVRELQHLLNASETLYASNMKQLRETFTNDYNQEKQRLEQQQNQQTQSLAERTKTYEQKKQSYEGSTQTSTTFAERKQRLTERRQSLELSRSKLQQSWKEHSLLTSDRLKLQATQQADLRELTRLKSNLENENNSLLENAKTLMQAGWLSEAELPPIDFLGL